MAKHRLTVFWLICWFGAALAATAHPEARTSPHELANALLGPSSAYWFGCDAFGRDLGRVVLQASARSSAFALVAAAAASTIALFLGTWLAFAPKVWRFGLLRVIETLLAFPSLLFALAWASIRGPGWGTLSFALLIGTIPSMIRLVYVRSRELSAKEFIEASRSLGASSGRIVLSHAIPTSLSLCMIKLPNLFAHALIAEATLSFLGVGAPIGQETWGSLLAQSKDYLIEAPHLAVVSGLPLVITVLCLQLLSESLSGGLSGSSARVSTPLQETQ